MALRIIIDGYNLLNACGSAGDTIEREALVERLALYKTAKGARVSVIFDARGAITLGGSTTKQKGVEVVFAPRNSDADSVIRAVAEKSGKGLTVVTSDSALACACERLGAVVIGSGEFIKLLDAAEYALLKDMEGDECEDDGRQGKKGPSRRLSKVERERAKRLKKM
jgi:predicted RNA-binding protein with PIN domain